MTSILSGRHEGEQAEKEWIKEGEIKSILREANQQSGGDFLSLSSKRVTELKPRAQEWLEKFEGRDPTIDFIAHQIIALPEITSEEEKEIQNLNF